MTPLVSTRPHPALSEQMQLYGQFVGEWDVEVTNYPEGEEPVRARGEWIFEWALEGRAVQDVWIVPARGERDPDDVAAARTARRSATTCPARTSGASSG